MLVALTMLAVLSQAWRSLPALMVTPLQTSLDASARDLALFAAAFHFGFALVQIPVGIALDLYGIRRTVTVAFLLTVVGAVLSALAPDLTTVIIGQALIGVGCSPAFVAAIVFVSKRFASARFATLSALVLGASGLGLLVTGTPMAWVIDTWSWRTGFAVLAATSLLSWLAVVAWVRDGPRDTTTESPAGALAQVGSLLRMPHTAGILILGAVSYAAFLALRAFWAVPLLIERHQLSLIDSGHVLLAMSIAALFGPPLFGRLTLDDRQRTHWIVACSLVMAALIGLLAVLDRILPAATVVTAALLVVIAVINGYAVLQYTDVKRAYPAAVVGRALALFTTSVFIGAGLMQGLTGAVATLAEAFDQAPVTPVLLTVAGVVVLATVAFARLPRPGFASPTGPDAAPPQ